MAESSTITREAGAVVPEPITILYTNYRGETAVRRIRIDFIAYGNEALGFGWGSNQWHPEPQMLLSALDVDKGERRTFALTGIKAWGEEAVRNAGWRARGEPDPHGDRYDCPRERLSGGHLTDDQVAFQTAMLMRSDLNHEAVLDVAKDRIRWLSRQVAKLSAALATGGARAVTTFRAGDLVRHKPMGETWTVAYADPVSNNLAWCGWPEGTARVTDCELIASATDEQHRDVLREVIKAGGTRAAAAQRLYGNPDQDAQEASHG